MADLKTIIARHNASQDALLHSFEHNLLKIVLRAQARVIARLQAKLSITDGVIDPTPGNMMVMRNAGKLFMQEMDRAGYQGLVDAFVGEFRGMLPFLQETLEVLGDQVGQQWGRDLGFTQQDLKLLGGVQANTVAALTGAIEAVAGQAVTRGLFGVAGLKFESLVDMLSTRFEMSVGRATSLGNTAMSSFYATASDRAFQIIEKDLPQQVLRYNYSGPDDKIIRAFCKHRVESKKSYTRAEIDLWDNGQFPVGSCFITRGGFNCRHQLVLAVDDLVVDQAA
jgi:hypothetical protein